MKMPSSSITTRANADHQSTGTEWVIDAIDCDAAKLCDRGWIRSLCDQLVSDLGLNVIGDPQCHQFPTPGGVTALYLLSESHLACHTYPEFSLATFNLYCCRDRDEWPWTSELGCWLGAREVRVRQIPRGGRSEP